MTETLRYWIAKEHLFIDDSCTQDLRPLPGRPLSRELSTIIGETRLQEEHTLNLGMRNHPKYPLHLLCMNLAVLDERNWKEPLQLRCPQCNNTYEFTQRQYIEEKAKLQ